MKIILLILSLFIAGCATVGGVEITEEDNFFTITTAVTIAIAILGIKGLIDFIFAMLLETYKHRLNKKKNL
jgi:hypothetical protein